MKGPGQTEADSAVAPSRAKLMLQTQWEQGSRAVGPPSLHARRLTPLLTPHRWGGGGPELSTQTPPRPELTPQEAMQVT